MVSDFRNAGAPVTAVDFNNNVTDIRRAVLHESPGILMDSSPMGGTSIAPVRQKRQIWDSGVDKDPAPFTLKWINTNAKEKTYNATESDREFRKMSANYYPIVHLPKCAVDTTPDDYAICLNPALDIFADSAWNNGNWCYLVNEKYDYSNGYSFSISETTAARLVPATDATDVDVYLHVRLSDDVDFKKKILGKGYASVMSSADARLCAYVVTTSQSIPAALGGEETRCVCVGRLFCPTQSQIKDSYVPRVTSQYIRSQFNCATEESEKTYRPFSLYVYKDASTGISWPMVCCPDGCVQVHDGNEVCFPTMTNTIYTGTDWCYVANDVSDRGEMYDYALDTILSSDGVKDVYLFVFKETDSKGKYYEFALFFDDTWPSSIAKDDRVACILVGSFMRETVTGTDAVARIVYSVASQVINDAQIVRTGGEEELYPFKLKRVNEGTEDAPDWKTVVYLPYDAVQADGWAKFAERSATNAAVEGMAGWHYVDDEADANEETNGLKVYLHVHAYFWVVDSGNVAGGSGEGIKTSSLYCDYLVSRNPTASITETFEAEGDLALGEKKTLDEKIAIGTFDTTTNETTNWVRSAFNVSRMFQSLAYEDWWMRNVWTGGGSGGGTTVKVQRDGTTVADFVSTATEKDGAVTITTGGSLAASAVKLGDGDSASALDVYLKGGAMGFGTNVNTENFEKQCLGGSGSSTTASRSDHTHTLEDLGLSVDDILGTDFYSNVDSYIDTAVESQLPTAINSALNDTTVDEDGIVTETPKFAYADHSHGNIDKDGKITNATGGLFVTTGNDGTISETTLSDRPNAYTTDAAYLSAVLDTFAYDSAKSQFTLSTDNLKYTDLGSTGHSGDCLLKVDKDGYVSHDGNASYNALYDLKTNHFNSDSKANEGKGEIALKYTALALTTNETLDANATKAVVFKGASLATTSGKAELADVAVLAPKTGDNGASASYAPVADSAVGTSENDTAKIARVGTSSYAARADHVHPVCTDMGTGATSEEMTNSDSWVSAARKKTDTWTPGDKGFTESYCSRVYKASGYSYFIFRTRKVSKTGAVVYRGPEYCMFCVSNE